jgi:hypothetical protein
MTTLNPVRIVASGNGSWYLELWPEGARFRALVVAHHDELDGDMIEVSARTVNAYHTNAAAMIRVEASRLPTLFETPPVMDHGFPLWCADTMEKEWFRIEFGERNLLALVALVAAWLCVVKA